MAVSFPIAFGEIFLAISSLENPSLSKLFPNCSKVFGFSTSLDASGYIWLINLLILLKLSALYNDNKEIIEWYFDIAKEIGKENGIPYEDDLYLDVVVNTKGEITLLDEDELKVALDRLEISKEDYNMAYAEANQLMNKLVGNKDKLEEFTNKYLEEMRGE